MLRADCHCHTTFSDGTLSVDELLQQAKSKELTGLSITDHDTLAAYEIAPPLAKTLNIELISGIEISCEHNKNSIHVLGYAFDLNNPDLQTFCQKLQQARLTRNQKILERLTALKMPLTLEELHTRFPLSNVGRPHIAHLMVLKGYVKSMKQAFNYYLGDKGRCYVAGCHVSIPEAIEIIHRAKGFAILAHPHYIRGKKILNAVLENPFDGLEGYYGPLPPNQEKPYIDIATQRDWLITGGSDFHGNKKGAPLGSSFTPAATFDLFVARFKAH
jgi:3',5'-nucleoside bisphosphate phosphatase